MLKFLEGLTAFVSAQKFLGQKLRYPLMCLLDYRGFRLIALSVLPINKLSIKYGSNNGGIVVHTDDEKLNKNIEVFVEKDLNCFFIFLLLSKWKTYSKETFFFILRVLTRITHLNI